jgi:hypothetical protein
VFLFGDEIDVKEDEVVVRPFVEFAVNSFEGEDDVCKVEFCGECLVTLRPSSFFLVTALLLIVNAFWDFLSVFVAFCVKTKGGTIGCCGGCNGCVWTSFASDVEELDTDCDTN